MGQFWTSDTSKGPQGATMKAQTVAYFFIEKKLAFGPWH